MVSRTLFFQKQSTGDFLKKQIGRCPCCILEQYYHIFHMRFIAFSTVLSHLLASFSFVDQRSPSAYCAPNVLVGNTVGSMLLVVYASMCLHAGALDIPRSISFVRPPPQESPAEDIVHKGSSSKFSGRYFKSLTKIS